MRGWQLICRRTCSNVTPCLGALAQLVARLGRIEKVTGSTPVCSTTMMEGRPVRSPLLSSLCQLCVNKVQHRVIGERWRQVQGTSPAAQRQSEFSDLLVTRRRDPARQSMNRPGLLTASSSCGRSTTG